MTPTAVDLDCENLMATPHDPDGGEFVAAFERLVGELARVDLPDEVRAQIQQFDQSLRHHVRTAELQLTRYEFLFEAAPDPYLVTDSSGVITEVNAAARSFLGVEAPRPAQRPLVDFVTPAERDRFHGWLRNFRAGAPEARWDTSLQLPGQPRPVPVEISLADDLEGVGYRWLLRDQRERAAAEQQLRAVAEREHRAADDLRAEARINSQFLRSLSHDLRGPIGALIHQSELLTSDGLSPEIRARSRAALEDNAGMLRQILEALVDVERYATGELDLHPVPIPAAELVATLHRSDEEDGVRLGDLDPTVVVEVDPEVVRRALLTVVNAVKTADGGQVHLDVRSAGEHALVEVRTETEHPVEEARIDLRLARTLIEMHGGSLHHTRDGNRHTATVSLPHGSSRAQQ